MQGLPKRDREAWGANGCGASPAEAGAIEGDPAMI
jgi:hypothetical protein